MSYAVQANNKVSVFLSWGTEDDLVDIKEQSEPFMLALKQAGFFVRLLDRAVRAALLDRRSDRRARQLHRLPCAATAPVLAGTAVKSRSRRHSRGGVARRNNLVSVPS